jgi:hypothetical protein
MFDAEALSGPRVGYPGMVSQRSANLLVSVYDVLSFGLCWRSPVTPRGVDREPEPKMGSVATTMERQGRLSHAGADQRATQAQPAAGGA